MTSPLQDGKVVLEDGAVFEGAAFGCPKSIAGEVVFNTGMVGYPETLTDPSYRGQILVLTYPLIGNYGVPEHQSALGSGTSYESDRVQISGLIVSEVSPDHHHWSATKSLGQWLHEQGVPALSGVDTRSLAQRLRQKGSMLGKIMMGDEQTAFHDPNKDNLVAKVSTKEPRIYPGGSKRVIVVDCGCKNSIILNLLARGITVIRVPWDYDFLGERFDGVLISNGPGDPKLCSKTIAHVKRVIENDRPILGICLGHQILALATGAETFKLRFGHRGQNQPCVVSETKRCYITSQNHGYAVDPSTLAPDWEPWFTNLNDGTNEGIRHRARPFRGVQFHPEAEPGPADTNFVFDEFLALL